jgi:hypothetical protein
VTFPFETGTSLALVYALDDNMSPFWQLTAVVLVAVGVIAILTRSLQGLRDTGRWSVFSVRAQIEFLSNQWG